MGRGGRFWKMFNTSISGLLRTYNTPTSVFCFPQFSLQFSQIFIFFHFRVTFWTPVNVIFKKLDWLLLKKMEVPHRNPVSMSTSQKEPQNIPAVSAYWGCKIYPQNPPIHGEMLLFCTEISSESLLSTGKWRPRTPVESKHVEQIIAGDARDGATLVWFYGGAGAPLPRG